jgi:hypothetical protein
LAAGAFSLHLEEHLIAHNIRREFSVDSCGDFFNTTAISSEETIPGEDRRLTGQPTSREKTIILRKIMDFGLLG